MLKKNQNRILRKKEVKRMKIIKKTSLNEPKKKINCFIKRIQRPWLILLC